MLFGLSTHLIVKYLDQETAKAPLWSFESRCYLLLPV